MIQVSKYEGVAIVNASTWEDGSHPLWDCVCLQVATTKESITLILTKDEAAQLEFALEAAQREIRRREDERLNKEIEELDRKYPHQ